MSMTWFSAINLLDELVTAFICTAKFTWRYAY